jgi:hypothetical protein
MEPRGFQFADLNVSGAGDDGLNLGVVTSNPGTFQIDSGIIDGTAGDGIRAGSTLRGTTGGSLNLDNVVFQNIGGFTTNLTNTTVDGIGNTARPFSGKNEGGNTGTIEFNGGTDSAP